MMTAWPSSKAATIFKPLLLLLAAAALGCGEKAAERPDFGLVKVEIELDAEDHGELNSEVFLKEPVACRLRIDGTELQGTIRYSGQGTLDDYKKSYELGFGDGGYRGFAALRLNGQSVDPSGLRSLIAFGIFDDAGVATPMIEPAAVYLQGRYLGLYFLIENVDAAYFARRDLPLSTLYKAYLSQATFAPDTAANVTASWNVRSDPALAGDLVGLIETVAARSDEANLQELEARLDIDGFLRYLAVATYLNHLDGIVNNFILWRPRGATRFQVVAWDVDRIWEKRVDTVTYLDDLLHVRSRLTAKLLATPRYAERYREHLLALRELAPLAEVERRLDLQASAVAAAFAADRVLSARPGGLAARRAELGEFAKAWLEDLDRRIMP
jgi:spore coat protein H